MDEPTGAELLMHGDPMQPDAACELERTLWSAGCGVGLPAQMKVFRADGSEERLLVHIAIQGRQDAGFPQRMFTCAYRLYDRCARGRASLAVLADTTPDWRPAGFKVGRGAAG